MKKLLAILMTICLMASARSMLAVPAAADDSGDIVMTVSGITEDGSIVSTERYTSFADGWNQAAKLAKNRTWMDESGLVYIVVDLLGDWTADDKGEFGSGDGFKENTICVPENTKMMINMQGHTINRGLTKSEDHGEVIFMGKNSQLIINGGSLKDETVEVGKAEQSKDKMGTITGGNSHSGAGGIHLDGNNKLILNNVHVDGNGTHGERGAGIALFNDSTLIMNGGSISNNLLKYRNRDMFILDLSSAPSGSLYLKNSTATLNNVELCNDNYPGGTGKGTVIYATDGSSLTMENCLVSNNGTAKSGTRGIIYSKNSTLNITETDFIDNCPLLESVYINGSKRDNYMFNLENSTVYLTGGKLTGNAAEIMFHIQKTQVELRDVTITDNSSWLMNINNEESQKVTLINCTLNNNDYPNKGQTEFRRDINVNKKNILSIDGGDLGDTSFNDKSLVTDLGAGSIFGEGSLTMIVAIVALGALIASGVSLFLVADMKKKVAAAAAKDEE